MGTHLCRIHFPLDDVEDGNVAVVGLPVSPCGHHHVFRLQQPSHHVQDCGFPHTGHLHRPAKGQREQVCCSLPSCCLVHTHTHTPHTKSSCTLGMESHAKPHAGQGNPNITQRHSQAKKQSVSGGSSMGAVWPPPCSTAGAGGEAQLRTEGQEPVVCCCCQTWVLSHCQAGSSGGSTGKGLFPTACPPCLAQL